MAKWDSRTDDCWFVVSLCHSFYSLEHLRAKKYDVLKNARVSSMEAIRSSA